MSGPSINKVFLLGNLGDDVELRTTGSGKPVANFTLATNEGRGDNERVEWHRIVVWDRLAEQCHQYLAKGRQVHIEGRLQTRSWEDRDGNKRKTTEVVAYSVLFLGSDRGDGGGRRDDYREPGGYDGDEPF